MIFTKSRIDALRFIWPTVLGHRLLLLRLFAPAWPRIAPLARLYRRRIIPRTCIIAVVGSLGKTTTRRMVAAGLGGRVPRQPDENCNHWIAIALFRVGPWHKEAVMEVGISTPGEMAPIADFLKPNIVVVTSIRHSEHNRTLRTLEETRIAKADMVRSLPAAGTAILNGDDPHVMWMATQTKARVITFGMGPDNEVRATDVRIDGTVGTRFTLHAAGTAREVRINLLGKHLVYTALAAVAVALLRGRTLDETVTLLQAVDPAPHRMRPLQLTGGITVIGDDFKSPLETIIAALDTFAAIPARRHVVVLGNIEYPPGPQGPLYKELGRRLSPWADRVLLIGSNRLKSVITGAEAAGMDRSKFTYAGSSIDGTIALLRRELKEGDVVLVKGTSSQRLERVILALQGRTVRCPLKTCHVNTAVRCAECPVLERGSAAFTNRFVRNMANPPPTQGQ
jgi:UDP-N-acetylmuramoyl-tripeptide--D-alanyl-D-alanine ligase